MSHELKYNIKKKWSQYPQKYDNMIQYYSLIWFFLVAPHSLRDYRQLHSAQSPSIYLYKNLRLLRGVVCEDEGCFELIDFTESNNWISFVMCEETKSLLN